MHEVERRSIISVNIGNTAKIRGRPTRRSAALTLNSGNSERYAFV